jgi:hypothetical protein
LEEPLLKNVKPKNAVLPYKKDDLNYEEQLFSPSKEFQKQGTHETINSEQLREGDDYHPEVVAQTPPFITARADITMYVLRKTKREAGNGNNFDFKTAHNNYQSCYCIMQAK